MPIHGALNGCRGCRTCFLNPRRALSCQRINPPRTSRARWPMAGLCVVQALRFCEANDFLGTISARSPHAVGVSLTHRHLVHGTGAQILHLRSRGTPCRSCAATNIAACAFALCPCLAFLQSATSSFLPRLQIGPTTRCHTVQQLVSVAIRK